MATAIQSEFLSLKELFDGATFSYFTLQEKGASSQDDLDSCIAKIATAISAVERESYFSDNEELDDYPTSSLKYLYLEYYLGKVYGMSMEIDPSKRISHLQSAKDSYQKYLSTCNNLRLLHDDERSTIEVENESKRVCSAEEKRSRKIEKYKRQKEAQQQMNSLKRLLNKFKDNIDSDQDEEVRRLSILQLQSFARDCIDELDIIKEELQLLEIRRTMTDPEAQSDLQRMSPLPPVDFYTSNDGGPSGPGLSILRLNKIGDQVVMHRDQIHGRVFGGGIAPPSMTLEEYADGQMADAKARQEAEKQAEEGAVRRQKDLERDGDEDDLSLSDQATVKDREWDEFREENPRGWGNKMGKRY